MIGAAAAIAVVLVIALIVASSGDDSSSEDGPPTSPAQVPAGPKTTVPASPTAAPPSQPPAPNVAPDALPGLLLPAEQINQRMNTSGMTTLPIEHAPLAGTVTPPHCTGVWGPAYQGTYDGSGYTGLAIQGVQREPSHKVAQAVVSFPDAGRAKAFYDKQIADWNACKSGHIRWEYGGNVNDVDVGVPAVTAGVMTVMLFPTNSQTAGQQCERDITVRGNVIVDVRACSPTVGSAGLSIASAIADKVAPAP
ncbi:sensor domain-containing protein [Mycolicibacterium celeriflavum]|uniref:sensor domain-containing protein n=1 Tax=Mycolicibacterium celeriflavum TaxID=1249101 RepID=UPI0013F4F839|nr:sensor domain-containing protein [Mycolicibacterium celeriflavum]